MAFSKVTYVDGVTIITAKNLNDIQDELIRQGEQQAEDEAELALKANAADVQTALALKADKSNTYTKSEVDTALNGKADKSTTYTKTEVDSALALKANTADVNSALALKADKSDTYTKAAVDASLALKADKSDTYTKTEVDNALALKADASSVYTKSEIDTELEDYANVDGSYEGMTVGNAEQLVTNLTDTESEPFTFRTSGGNLEIGDREELKVVGGSVAWNQLVKNGNFENANGWGASNVDSSSITVSGNVYSGTFSSTTSLSTPIYRNDANFIAGHKTLVLVDVKTSVATRMRLRYPEVGTAKDVPANSWFKYSAIAIASATYLTQVGIQFSGVEGETFSIKNFVAFDLTQMFGTTIADYIYNLELSTAGAGVAFFKKYFPKDYYTYNAGEMLHVQTSEFKTVGFNQWDEEWELGYYDQSGQAISGNSNIRSKNYIPVLPNTTYHAKGTPLYVCQYDADKNFIGTRSDVSNGNFITLSNAHFIRFNMGSAYGTTYKNDICINLHWDGTRDGEYEPYTEHSYPLDDSLTLRGVPKLDANNNLYFDGDTYEHDGTVTRKYGIVDLGTLNWSSATNRKYINPSSINMKVPPNSNTLANLIISNPYWTQVVATSTLTEGTFAVTESRLLFYFDGTTLPSGYLVYELATPTTEEAEPYQTPQIVDNWGTEEFVVTEQSGVAVPVGHETVYPISLRDKLESAPNLPDDDGDYLLHMANGEATYKQLVSEFPSAPTTDGTYVLKATVSNGTATLTWVAE